MVNWLRHVRPQSWSWLMQRELAQSHEMLAKLRLSVQANVVQNKPECPHASRRAAVGGQQLNPHKPYLISLSWTRHLVDFSQVLLNGEAAQRPQNTPFRDCPLPGRTVATFDLELPTCNSRATLVPKSYNIASFFRAGTAETYFSWKACRIRSCQCALRAAREIENCGLRSGAAKAYIVRLNLKLTCDFRAGAAKVYSVCYTCVLQFVTFEPELQNTAKQVVGGLA